jgi:AcrR family transcriptional regulator
LTLALVLEPRVRSRARAGEIGATRVDELQRTRLISAVIATIEDKEDVLPSVAQITSQARVSRKTFYDLFGDREECFLAAFEETFARAQALSADAYRAERSWRAGVRAGLACLLEQIDHQPALARLVVVAALGAGDRVKLRRDQLMLQLADTVDLGREAASPRRELSHMTAEGVVGGITAILHRRLVRRDRGNFVELLGPLMGMIVLPYLGPRAAREEERRAYRPRGSRPRPKPSSDPLSGMSIRLTYRTVRVLVALAERPDASNREVAELAGITDQGQISKLLARLARLGLIENRGEGQAKGTSNAWSLTDKGARLEHATHRRML